MTHAPFFSDTLILFVQRLAKKVVGADSYSRHGKRQQVSISPHLSLRLSRTSAPKLIRAFKQRGYYVRCQHDASVVLRCASVILCFLRQFDGVSMTHLSFCARCLRILMSFAVLSSRNSKALRAAGLALRAVMSVQSSSTLEETRPPRRISPKSYETAQAAEDWAKEELRREQAESLRCESDGLVYTIEEFVEWWGHEKGVRRFHTASRISTHQLDVHLNRRRVRALWASKQSFLKSTSLAYNTAAVNLRVILCEGAPKIFEFIGVPMLAVGADAKAKKNRSKVTNIRLPDPNAKLEGYVGKELLAALNA